MIWMEIDTWIAVTGALAALACALPGTFLVLRKMSMMGDAISHAVLPGIAIAFLITGSRSSWVMFLAAALTGVITAGLTEYIRSRGRIDEGASMGVVFTSFFALGLILIVTAADHVDLDPGCVLYGALELTPLDTVRLALGPFIFDIPRATLVLGAVTLLNTVLIALFFKELRVVTFDPDFADASGISTQRVHALLMILTALTTVAAFEAIGSILVVAMLIVPPSTALLLTHQLRHALLMAGFFAVASAPLGHWAAVALPGKFGLPPTNSASMIALASGFLCLLVIISVRCNELRLQRPSRRKETVSGSASSLP